MERFILKPIVISLQTFNLICGVSNEVTYIQIFCAALFRALSCSKVIAKHCMFFSCS